MYYHKTASIAAIFQVAIWSETGKVVKSLSISFQLLTGSYLCAPN